MQERHADVIDEANVLAAALTEGAIATARRANAPETHPDFDGENCVDCGDPIPPGRLKLRKVRCVECQSALEKRNLQTAKPGWGGGTPTWDNEAE